MPRAFDSGFSAGFGGPHNNGTLLLKVGSTDHYQDGDIVCAFNRRRTRHVHAQTICQPRLAPRQSNGLIATDHISRAYLHAVSEFKFERVGPQTVVRTNLWTGDVDVISNTPNQKGESMDVETFVRRRQQVVGFGLFGAEGAEMWYGGRQRSDNATLSSIWMAIEEHTPERETDYGLWPFGTYELQHFLAIHVDDFDDIEADNLTAPEIEEPDDPENPEQRPVVIRKRKHHLPWRELRGMSSGRIAQVEDRNVPVDVRPERKHVRVVHVRAKN